MPQPHIMIDIETAGRDPDAIILEIGAIAFDPETFLEIDRFHACPSWPEQVHRGRTKDKDTLTFHEKQGTRLEDFLPPAPFVSSLSSFLDWVKGHNPARLWAWGHDFERPILEHAAQSIGRQLPWRYNRFHCARSIWALAFDEESAPPRPHRAIPDCEAEIRDLATAVREIGGWPRRLQVLQKTEGIAATRQPLEYHWLSRSCDALGCEVWELFHHVMRGPALAEVRKIHDADWGFRTFGSLKITGFARTPEEAKAAAERVLAAAGRKEVA